MLVFLESGLLLFRSNTDNLIFKKQDDLVTGFFSAIFHYFSDQDLGLVHSIKTDKKFIFVQKIQNLFITLIVSTLNRNEISEEMNFDQILYFNKMLENITKNLMINIKRTILGHLKKNNIHNGLDWPDNIFFKKIDAKIHNYIDESNRKIEIIKQIPKSNHVTINQLYKNT